MAIYVVTGKLGGGKTLGAVSKISEALGRGLRVATNLDLNVHQLPSCSRRSTSTRVTRVPDHPTVEDIKALGYGQAGVSSASQARSNYDEDKFGCLVLDECGTWLNSRDWQADGRRELISYLLHIRKMGWNVYLIIQDISMLDKQARKSLAEHVVYCRRFDRIGIPIISKLLEGFGVKLRMPKVHMGIVKYGDQPQSLTVDRWWYNGRDLYDAFDTTQVFDGDYEHGSYSLVPPYAQFSRMFVVWDWRKYMRLTRIYFRKWSLSLLLASGVVAGASASMILAPEKEVVRVEHAPQMFAPVDGAVATVDAGGTPAVATAPVIHRVRVSRIFNDVAGEHVVFTAGTGVNYRASDLAKLGLNVSKVGTRSWRLDDGSTTKVLGVWD